jgi:hypothetical protein
MKVRILLVCVVLIAAVSATWAKGPGYEKKFTMHAVGDVSLDPTAPPSVVAPAPLNLPPFLMPPLMQGVLKIVASTDVKDGNVTIGVWVVPGPAFDLNQIPNELGGIHFPPSGVPISMFVIKIQDVAVGDAVTTMTSVGPQASPRTITFLGKVTDVLVPSPFGAVAGRTAAISAEFDKVGNDVTFSFVGGFVAGSHSTWTFTGTGSLTLPPE